MSRLSTAQKEKTSQQSLWSQFVPGPVATRLERNLLTILMGEGLAEGLDHVTLSHNRDKLCYLLPLPPITKTVFKARLDGFMSSLKTTISFCKEWPAAHSFFWCQLPMWKQVWRWCRTWKEKEVAKTVEFCREMGYKTSLELLSPLVSYNITSSSVFTSKFSL